MQILHLLPISTKIEKCQTGHDVLLASFPHMHARAHFTHLIYMYFYLKNGRITSMRNFWVQARKMSIYRLILTISERLDLTSEYFNKMLSSWQGENTPNCSNAKGASIEILGCIYAETP